MLVAWDSPLMKPRRWAANGRWRCGLIQAPSPSTPAPQSSALNQAPWQRLEAQETALAKREKIAVYVLTGPLFERVLPALPGADERHRVPSAYWKVVATADGRTATFIMDQSEPRSIAYCARRVALEDAELRSRLAFFPRLTNRSMRDLGPALGCAADTRGAVELDVKIEPKPAGRE